MALSVLSCFCGSSVDLICSFIFLYSLPDSSQIKTSTKQRYLTYQRCKDPVCPCITVKFKEIGPMLCFPLVTGWKNTRLQISLLPWHLRCGDATKSRAVSAQEVHKLFLLFAKAGCKDQHLSEVTTCSPLCSEELDGWERSTSQASLQGIKLCRRHWASTWPGIFLHQVEQLNKSFLVWGGVVLVFCLFLFN